jgi:two-component system sensor histidine kinase YesM
MRMKIFKLIWKKIKDMKVRTKLVLSYLFLIMLPSIIIGVVYFNTSSNIILNSSKQNIYEIVKKNNQIIDIKLSQVEESALKLILDKELYVDFSKGRPYDESDYLLLDRDITQILDRYFSQYDYVKSTYLVTSHNQFGKNDISFLRSNAFSKTQLYKSALKGNGRIEWVPTYNIKDMFDINQFDISPLNYPPLFSAVKQLNITLFENYGLQGGWNSQKANQMQALPKGVEHPVLVINLDQSLFSDIYNKCTSIKDADYYIVSKEGEVISNTNYQKLPKKNTIIELVKSMKDKSGTKIENINSKKMLVCYDTLNTNKWVSVIVAPVDSILSSLPLVRNYTIYLAILITFLSILLSYIISGWIVKPLKKLLVGVKRMAHGNFDTEIFVPSKDEIGVLIFNFNDMNLKIKQLISENYEVKIREKEAQIMALNLQLNPHFLYNSLNTINLMAIENNQIEISEMILSLSTMLQYTVKNNKEKVSFQEDLLWLKSYIFIMSNRFLGMFTVDYDFEEIFSSQRVPKLFLQPFVENSLIHGFENIEEGGLIRIYGRIEEDNRCFYVEDNGKGMTEEEILFVINNKENKIGLNNIDQRIKLIYGQEYGVNIYSESEKGTKIKITMPYDEI